MKDVVKGSEGSGRSPAGAPEIIFANWREMLHRSQVGRAEQRAYEEASLFGAIGQGR